VGIIRASVFQAAPGSIFLSNSLILNNATNGSVISRTSAAPAVTVSNCTLVDNDGPFVMQGITAYNCVLAGNGPVNPDVAVQYSLLEEEFPEGGVGNIVGVPHFASAATGDYRLVPGSIGVDAGLSSLVAAGATLDLGGSPRVLDNPLTSDAGDDCPAVDMGAYETAGIIPEAPTVVLDASPIETDAPATIHLTAGVAGGNVTPVFRWTKNGVELSNGQSAGGGMISGATASGLTITNAGAADSGDYTLVVRASCQVVTTEAVSVLVRASCLADFNHDGLLNPDDLSEFITCFFLQLQFPGFCPSGDFNQDELLNPDDLSEFITSFFLGLQFGC
jgi:hypothetical protein